MRFKKRGFRKSFGSRVARAVKGMRKARIGRVTRKFFRSAKRTRRLNNVPRGGFSL